MPRPALKVTTSIVDDSRLTDAASESALHLMDLRARGQLDRVEQVVRIRRKGGYAGFDIWLWLMLLFASGLSTIALKEFWYRHLRPNRRQLAALAGRTCMASASSLSRALDAAEHDLVRPAIPVLLCEVAGADELMRHPATSTYDALGKPWSVFDLDATVTTLRLRGLPEAPELPEPGRLAERNGEPGYSGRKRGELQFRRVTLQHAGSGAWVHLHLSRGNGEGVKDLALALGAVVAAGQRCTLQQTLVRCDGEFGHVPAITEFQQRKLHFITRLNRLTLLDDQHVLARLRKARFAVVPDSASGPRRYACDLGILTLEPGEQTRRPDGTRYEAIKVRVVASVYESRDGKARSGRLLDGYVVELFATGLSVDAWPCHEVVASFFARAGQENRFGQEDRELGLDRIFSFTLAGQELACLVGLSVWNVRLHRGLHMAMPARSAPRQAVVEPQFETCVPTGWPRDPALLAALDALDWERLLRRHPGWWYDTQHHEVVCPEGRRLTLSTVREAGALARTASLVFVRPKGGCRECESRASCLHSRDADVGKHLELSVPGAVGTTLWVFLARQRGHLMPPARLEIEPVEGAWSGRHAVADSLFLPATTRRLFTDALAGSRVQIKVVTPRQPPRNVSLMASSPEERRHRRQTWSEKLARYALPDSIQPQVHVELTPALKRALDTKGVLLALR